MKVLMIMTDWGSHYRRTTGEYGGIGYYRTIKPAEYLRKLGWDVDVEGITLKDKIDQNERFESYKKLFMPYDVVVIKQTDVRQSGEVIGAAKELGVPIIMDLDDNIIEVSPDNPVYNQGYGDGEHGVKKALAAAAMSMVDGLFVSTQPLKDYYENYLKTIFKVEMPIFVLPNCCDPADWKPQSRNREKYTMIGWHGSVSHDKDLALATPAIKKIMNKHKDVHFEVIGGVRSESIDTIFYGWEDKDFQNMHALRGTPSWRGFPQLIGGRRWDIAIAPIVDNEFNRSKSHIKWLENSLLGVPTVASGVYPYKEPIHGTETIVDGLTGFLAENDEWQEKLSYLIKNKTERRMMGERAREFVTENCTYEKNVHLWDEALRSFL